MEDDSASVGFELDESPLSEADECLLKRRPWLVPLKEFRTSLTFCPSSKYTWYRDHRNGKYTQVERCWSPLWYKSAGTYDERLGSHDSTTLGAEIEEEHENLMTDMDEAI